MIHTDATKETWFVKYWRPAAAWIYLSICVFDFVAMPLYHMNSQGSLNRIVEISMQLRPEDQVNAIIQLSRKTPWEPITLMGAGMFHISFGAILGVAAWTRGRVQQELVRNQDVHDPPDHRDPPPRSPRRSSGGSGIDTQVY
jgi:hypothetical protein